MYIPGQVPQRPESYLTRFDSRILSVKDAYMKHLKNIRCYYCPDQAKFDRLIEVVLEKSGGGPSSSRISTPPPTTAAASPLAKSAARSAARPTSSTRARPLRDHNGYLIMKVGDVCGCPLGHLQPWANTACVVVLCKMSLRSLR